MIKSKCTVLLLLCALLPSAEAQEDGIVKIIRGTGIRMSSASYRIDPAKTYRLSGKFKASKPEKGWLLFGLAPLDAAGKPISPDMVNPVRGTDTVLTENAESGTASLQIRDSSGWKKGSGIVVKFNTRTDLGDLPNREGVPVDRIDGNTVILKTPLKKSYPAGTGVRLHTSGDTYMYSAAAYRSVPHDKWAEFSGEISGEAESGLNPKQFRRGTRRVRIMMLTNLHDVMFKDISLDEIQ